MISTKEGYEIKKYEVKDFLAESVKKARRQIVKTNSEMAIDAFEEVYSEQEQEFMGMQVLKLNVIEKILQVNDIKSLQTIEDIAENIANKNNAEVINNAFLLLTKTILDESNKFEEGDVRALKTLLSVLWNVIKKQGEGEDKKAAQRPSKSCKY